MKRLTVHRMKHLGLLCVLLTLIASGGVSLLHADKKETPTWPEITEQERNLKSVPQDPEADAVILRHTRDGKILIESRTYTNVLDYHWRLKVLTDRGKEYADVHIPSYNYARVSDIEARTIKPDGTIVTVAPDQIFEKLVEKSGGYKFTEQVFSFPAVEPGAILEYRYRGYTGRVIYIDPWYFAGREFTLYSRMSQAVHEDATYRVLCDKCPNPEPQTTPWKEGKTKGKLMTVEMRDIPAYKEERMMPPLGDISPRVEMVLKAMAYQEWEELGGRRDNLFIDWDSVAKFTRYRYQRIYKVDDVAVKQVVGGWIQGVTDPTEKLKTIFHHVQLDYRYNPKDYVEVRPRSLSEILKDKTADSEEKTVLLLAALRSIGVPANIVLVVGKDKGTLYTSFFSLSQFSHVMVAVPQPDGTALWLDPSVTYAPFGFMPWQDSGAGALYITDTGSALINLPQKDEASATRYQVTVKPRPDGKSDLDVVAEYQGEDAIEKRQELVPASDTSRISILQEWLKDARPGAALRSQEFENLKAIDKPLRIKMTIEAPELVTRADELMLVHGCVLECEDSNPISRGRRVHPFYVDRPWNDDETITIMPPEGMKMSQLPSPAMIKSAIGTMTFSCSSQSDGSARCVRRFVATKGRWSADEQDGIRAMYDKIVEADRNTVAFEKKAQ